MCKVCWWINITVVKHLERSAIVFLGGNPRSRFGWCGMWAKCMSLPSNDLPVSCLDETSSQVRLNDSVVTMALQSDGLTWCCGSLCWPAGSGGTGSSRKRWTDLETTRMIHKICSVQKYTECIGGYQNNQERNTRATVFCFWSGEFMVTCRTLLKAQIFSEWPGPPRSQFSLGLNIHR